MKTWLFIVLYSFLSWFVTSEDLINSKIDAELSSNQIPLVRVPLKKLLGQLVGGGQQNKLLNNKLEAHQNDSIPKTEETYKSNQSLDSNIGHVTSVSKQLGKNETQIMTKRMDTQGQSLESRNEATSINLHQPVVTKNQLDNVVSVQKLNQVTNLSKQGTAAIQSTSSTKHTSVLNTNQLGAMSAQQMSSNQSPSEKEFLTNNQVIKETNLLPALNEKQSPSEKESLTNNQVIKETNLLPALNEKAKTEIIQPSSSTKHSSVLNTNQLGALSAQQMSSNQYRSKKESVTKNQVMKEMNILPALNERAKTEANQTDNTFNTAIKTKSLSGLNQLIEGTNQGTAAANYQVIKHNIISTNKDLKQQNLGTFQSQLFKQPVLHTTNQLTKDVKQVLSQAVNKEGINQKTFQPTANKIQSAMATHNMPVIAKTNVGTNPDLQQSQQNIGRTRTRQDFNTVPSTTKQPETSFPPMWNDKLNFLTTKSSKNFLRGNGIPASTTLYSSWVTSTKPFMPFKPEHAADNDENYLIQWDRDQDEATDNDKDLLIEDEDQEHIHDDNNIDLDVDKDQDEIEGDSNLNIDEDQDRWEGDNNIHLNVDEAKDGDDQLWEEDGNGNDDKGDDFEDEKDINDDDDDFNSIADKTGDFWDEPKINKNPFIKDKFVTKNFKSPFAEEMRMMGFYSWVLFVTVLLLIFFVFFTQQRHRCGLLYGYRPRYRTPSVSVEEGKDLMKNMYS